MSNPPSARDVVFLRFMAAMIAVLLLYGMGAFLMALFGDGAIARLMLSAFASMFAAMLGFGSGYLIGRNGNGKS